MQYQLFFSVLLAAVTAVQGATPNPADLPQCASGPAFNGFQNTGCQPTDNACICKNQAFIDNLATTIQKDCNADEIEKVRNFANDLCADVGGINLPSDIGSASGPAPTNASTSATSPSSTTTPGSGATRFEWSVGILVSLGVMNAAVMWLGLF